jgi:outer membrane protein OmpA-like peptidoglycan-associated protein
MKNFINKCSTVVLTIVIIIGLTGCSATQNTVKNANNKQKGAAIGAIGGTILGAIIGNNTGKKGNGGGLGAVIGGVVGGATGVLIGSKMDKQAQQIKEEVPGATVQRIDNGIVITFDDNSGVHFNTNKYNIDASSESILSKLAKILTEYPDTKVLIVGHTDNVGSNDYNMVLSKNRAIAVTDFFIQKGLLANRFTTKWYGEEKPIADNETLEGRAKNRRVNLAIIPNEKMINDAHKEINNQ